jgi:hypothetical protein
MRTKPGGRELRFAATERFAVDRVAFTWRARFPLAGPLAIEVRDELAGDDGRLEVRALGLPLQRRTDRATVRGEALRYLAELPWVPFAMTQNPDLEWRELGERVEVAARLGGERLAVTFDLDASGDIVRASSEQRQVKLGKEWLTRPWAGEYEAYGDLGGIRLPTRAEVYWELESGRFSYWQGRVISVDLLDASYR